MHPRKRILCLLLALSLCLSLIPPAPAARAADQICLSTSYINPLYRHIAADITPAAPRSSGAALASETDYAEDYQEAADQLRPMLTERLDSCVIYFRTASTDTDAMKEDAHAIAELAVSHTGQPNEGDYLMWQFEGYSCSIEGYCNGNGYDLTLTYTYTYYTDADEEAQVDSKIRTVLDELNVSAASDYEKLKAAYDYICANVTYDNAHLEDSSYKKQFTAYAALIDGTAVCQGYALLLYRLALELNVDARLIAGTGMGDNHGWNILRLDGLYYNADATWDAGETSYSYFLRCPDNFPDHTRFDEFDTAEFHSAYPMAASDYDPDAVCDHSYTVRTEDATCTEDGTTTYTCDACGSSYSESIPATGHSYTAQVTDPTCTAGGYTTHTCTDCGDSYTDGETDAAGHSWDSGAVTQEPSESESGTRTYTCQICGDTRTESIAPLGSEEAEASVVRVMGDSRYETAFDTADLLRETLGLEKFSTVVVASGLDFADALPGSYLAVQNQAPILLVNDNRIQSVADYIRENTYSGGTVYVLGGEGAVTEEFDLLLEDDFDVRRLQGRNRYVTNIEILKAAGVAQQEILVCTGTDFADSLSASALGLPILLVKNALNQEQQDFLGSLEGCTFRIIGGEGAVSEETSALLEEYGTVSRTSGTNRYRTSVAVAERYFDGNAKNIVLAYGQNFPDGLCGGVLAYFLNAPLILTRDKNAEIAAEFAAEQGVCTGAVLGGTGLISDEAVREIFALEDSTEIPVK